MVQILMSIPATPAQETPTTVKAVATAKTGESTGGAKTETTVKIEGVSNTSESGTTSETAQPEKQPDNPILPTGPELAWGAFTFTLLWVLMKFWLLKPIQKTMAERADKVRGDVDAADGAKVQAEGAISEYEASLASARVEAGRVIDDARAEAEGKRKEIIAAAEAEVAELRAAAAAEVAAAKADALASMQASVASIAVQAAEAVVQKSIDADAQRSIVNDYLNRVGSQN